MRWFQLDSDTPNDPRMRVVLRALGNEGFGGLVRLWCHIANHGWDKKPGYAMTSNGKAMSREELIDGCGLSSDAFDQLVAICVESGHFDARVWKKRHMIAIPAMVRRADTYTKRRVRTRVEPSSKKVHVQNSTRQDSTREIPPTPRTRGARVTREHKKRAAEILRLRFGCFHEPRCANHQACLLLVAQDLAANPTASSDAGEVRH